MNEFECNRSECNRVGKSIDVALDSTLQLTCEQLSPVHFVIVKEDPGGLSPSFRNQENRKPRLGCEAPRYPKQKGYLGLSGSRIQIGHASRGGPDACGAHHAQMHTPPPKDHDASLARR